MQETDYARFAGIIDGEQSIFVSKVIVPENRCGFAYLAQLTESNAHRLVLKVKEIIGSGTVSHTGERSDWKDRYAYPVYDGVRTVSPKMPYLVAKTLHGKKGQNC